LIDAARCLKTSRGALSSLVWRRRRRRERGDQKHSKSLKKERGNTRGASQHVFTTSRKTSGRCEGSFDKRTRIQTS
jgi:hypothetical protein